MQNHTDTKQTGTLYGIGVGPGNPELLTLKAVRVMEQCDVLAVPGKNVADSVAYQIAVRAVPELQEKAWFSIEMPMTRDAKLLEESHESAADVVEAYLKEGKQVGILNLGDITIYATFLYVQKRIAARGYHTEMVNGIPSFCATAATLGFGIAEGKEQIHILSQPDQIEEGLKLSGTKIIMKMGKNMAQVKQWIRDAGMEACMIENCGMPGERIFRSVDEIDEQAGYYSLLIVKEKKTCEVE